MPAPLATAFLAFGAVLTAADTTLAVIFAAIGLLIELFMFYTSGVDAR